MKKGEIRKLELLKTAYSLFVTRGYEKTSVDMIIEEAGIAKGTYYYYFSSKEQMLEEVIEMMLNAEFEKANKVLEQDLPVAQKIVGIISSIKPSSEEQTIERALHEPENVLMHDKIRKKVYDELVPILAQVAQEGVDSGVFDCDNIPERVRLLVAVGSFLFDDSNYTETDIEVFLDVMEKTLGAEKGSLAELRAMIS